MASYEMMTTFSARHKFAAWPNRDLPAESAGAYAVWDSELLVYCGMSGREFEKAVEATKLRYGLVTPLASHAA